MLYLIVFTHAQEAQSGCPVAGRHHHDVTNSREKGAIQQAWLLIGRGVEEENQDWDTTPLTHRHTHIHLQINRGP